MLAVLGAMEEEIVRLRARLTDVREETVARVRVAADNTAGAGHPVETGVVIGSVLDELDHVRDAVRRVILEQRARFFV